MDLFCIIAVVACAGGLLMVDFREWQAQGERELPETEILYRLARMTETSEFEQFKRAAHNWNLPEEKAEADFNHYLLQDQLPFYVRDYLRKAGESDSSLRRPMGWSGFSEKIARIGNRVGG